MVRTWLPRSSMPVRYRILKPLNLVHSTWDGVVTLEESIRHNAELGADPDFDPDMRQLSDARTATSAVTGEGVRSLAKQSSWGAGSRRAILVSDSVMYGVSRMYEAQEENSGDVRIFEDRDEALRWLGVDPAELPERTLS